MRPSGTRVQATAGEEALDEFGAHQAQAQHGDSLCTRGLGTHDLIVGKIRRTACSDANPVVHDKAATHRLSQRDAAVA